MLLASYDIVFQEIPGEVTLALNISGCPNRCPGCHSPHLRENIGETLDDALVDSLLERYGRSVTCVCFMGGDGDPHEVERLAGYIRDRNIRGTVHLKTGWYSGRSELPEGCDISRFDFIKSGEYIEALGGLDSPATNQRFYRIENGSMNDITTIFQKSLLLNM